MSPEQHAKVLEALEIAVRQSSHDMLMTGEEIRACESALSIMRADGVEQRPAIRAATYVTGPQGGKASFHFDSPEEGEAWFERLLAECPAPPTEHEVKP